jgi:polar amino acid transport system substrate-binding protein
MKRVRLAAVMALAAMTFLTACSGSDDDGTTAGASGAGTSAAFDQALFDQLPQSIQQSKVIRFGALWETPPFISVDPKDTSKPVGLTPDLAAAVSKVLGVTPQWQNLQWPAQLPGLQAGNVDVLWGQISDGADREKSVADIVAYAQGPLGLLLAKGNPHHVGALADTCGLRVAVPTGSQQSDAVAGISEKACTSQGKPAITAVGYPGAQQAIVALQAGSVDAWFDSLASIKETADAAGFDSVALQNSEIDQYMETISGVAVAKNQPGLTQAIAGALQKLAQSGDYQKIMANWDMTDSAMAADAIKINTYTGTPVGQSA